MPLTPQARVIIMTAAATYSALLSSYYLARPMLRGFALQTSLALDFEPSPEPEIEGIRRGAVANVKKRLQQNIPSDRRSTALGIALLVFSLLLYTGAVVVQLSTDPAFNPGGPATANTQK